MPRVNDYLDLVDSPSRQGLTPGDPADDALISLLAHVAFTDGEVDEAELDFLEKVLPGRDRDQLRDWAMTAGSVPMDWGALVAVLPTFEERWTGLRFAARMAWKDLVLAPEERVFLTRLASALELPEGSVERVLSEMEGRASGDVTPLRVEQAVGELAWDAVQHGTGGLRSELADLVPEGATVVARIGLDDVEVLAILHEGIVGRFLEGNAFLKWPDIVTYSRVIVLGATLQLHTESGARWTLVDQRMHGLAVFFDRLFGQARPEAKKARKPLKVELVRGD